MSRVWKLTAENGIGILEIDVPDTEVNVLTTEGLTELRDIAGEIAGRSDLRALVIVSAKSRIFIAGADIKEIDGIKTKEDAVAKAEQGKAVFQKIEDLKIPVVCVINGACLGGGYELALSCTARTASFSPNVKIGLPEVNLGILPGFGGSIRLPRLLGLLKAMPLILAGKIVSAQDALKNGMVDKLFPEKTLREDSIAFARSLADGAKPRRPRKKDLVTKLFEDTPPGKAYVFSRAEKDVLAKTKGFYPAPLEIIRLLRATYGMNSPQAYKLESDHFANLGTTDVSKNLIKVFFLSEKYKKIRWTPAKVPAWKVKKCGVIGAGVMGGGIAQLVTTRDIPVRVKDLNEKALAGALKEARSIYSGALKRRKIKKHDLENKMGLISVGTTNKGLKNCEILIEAVVEDMGIKQKVFKELSGIGAPDTVLASNTSSLSVTQMASVCKNPERVTGLHFFNPVHRMPLVEVIRAQQSSDEAIEKTVQFARNLGKTVIVVKDAPGFLVNRLLLPYMNEAAFLLQEGMSAETIDRLAEKFGMPMGPIELVDQVGIDVGYKVAHVLHEAFGERMKVAKILEDVKAKGLLGKKSQKGFYVYDGKKKSVNPEVPAAQKTSGVSEEDAVKRMIYIMINEAARCLDEKVVDGPASVDIGMIMGTGFPPFRGGLLAYADSVGLANVVKDLERFQNSVSRERFEPAPYLAALAKSGKKFF
ncbi:MAG TPA: 3-hydroxyacyl-CoA dehydrogenase NAD-binding domain-containing protein [Verrucomicrobiae bacterium]|nr:3-hydroxyacyl-CoA dehydrogenase NAD-binding domain-containing protein [Verrucomicrobiae bacterium]